MRRCGSTFCLVLVGLLAAATAAGGAYAAAGGNQGKGHAWAKGQAKHAAATPQLSQPPVKTTVKTTHRPPEKSEAPAAAKHSPPGATTRHVHLTICHRTGSGRYIVISPSINGALNGHLRHHDDFPYVDGCSKQKPVSAPNPVPERSPKQPAEGTSVDPSPAVASSFRGDLPFTGFPVRLIAIAGAFLLAIGLALRSTARPGLMVRRHARGTR